MTDRERFVVDCMLGTLAKWLRIVGYDTLYRPYAADHELVRLARAEGRILLTRDRGIMHRRGVRALFIEDETVSAQLAQVTALFSLPEGERFSRCPVCNTVLEAVPRHAAWGQVPPFVFCSHEEFKLCPDCGRFYWRGTHWQDMTRKLERLSQSQ